jgi:Immunity protein 63
LKTLIQLEEEIKMLSKIIGAASKDLPTFGFSEDGARPHVEVDKKMYHYVIVERGRKFERRSTENIQELLYWVFSTICNSLAFSYELNNRIEDQDCRRLAFPKQIELMEMISDNFGQKAKEEIDAILKTHPYDDEPIKRASRIRQKN